MRPSFPFTKRIIHRFALFVLGKAANTDQEAINAAIDTELQQPLRLSAAQTPDSKLYVKASQIVTADGGFKSVSPVGPLIPSLDASWVDFQAQTTSGVDVIIAFPTSTVGKFRRCAFSLSSNNTLIAAFSFEAASTSALPNAGTLFQGNSVQIGWVDLECTHTSGRFKTAGSSTAIIENSQIYRIAAGGGGSGNAGLAQEVSLTSGISNFTVTFPSPVSSTNYTPYVQIVNLTDANPAFLFPIVTNKTVNGFDVIWNDLTDSANYRLCYIVPGVQLQQGEATLTNGLDNITVTLPTPLDNTNYSVIAQLVNYTDSSPQLQTVVVTNKAANQFSVKWNDPVDSGNYRLTYQVAYFS